MDDLIAYLLNNNISISSMESLTGGLFAALITSYSGVSKIYSGSLVTYSDSVKMTLGHVDPTIINKHGAISKETAQAMAENCQKLFKSDIAVSFTGNAGPDAQEAKPVGLIYTCIYIYNRYYLYEDHLVGDRSSIRETIIDKTCERIAKNLGIKGI